MKAKALLPLFALILACGGGGGGGGPQGPTAPTNQVVVSVAINALTGGVQEATLSLDGRELGRGDWTALTLGCGGNCQVQGTASDLRSGAHEITVTINRQTQTTVAYIFLGVVIVSEQGGGRTIDLPRRDVSLRAGQSVTYPITIYKRGGAGAAPFSP